MKFSSQTKSMLYFLEDLKIEMTYKQMISTICGLKCAILTVNQVFTNSFPTSINSFFIILEPNNLETSYDDSDFFRKRQ